DATGKASFTIATFGAGNHSVTATYTDGPNFSGSNDSFTQAVNAAATTTTETSSVNPSNFGQAVTVTATVTSGFTTVNTGSVTFKEGSTTLADSIAVDATGKASFTTATLTVGNHNIKATYSDGASFSSSNITISQTVNQAPTSTALTSSLNPSVVGVSVTFTAIVTATGG